MGCSTMVPKETPTSDVHKNLALHCVVRIGVVARLDRDRVHSFDESQITDHERQSILSLCKYFGLEMGSIDLIRADEGTLYFLEINEQGQWMFLA